MPMMKAEGMMKFLKFHHMVTTIVITDSGTNHQWMVKLVGKNLVRNELFI